MSNAPNRSLTMMLLSSLAMLAGMGVLLFELTTGLIFRSVPPVVLWGLYLVLLLISVWGMKTWLELQADSLSVFGKTLWRLVGGGRPKKVQSHNLFILPAEGQIYVLMLTIMLLGALFGKTNTLMLIFALMAGPFIVNGGITFMVTRRLEMKRSLPRRIMQGEPTSVDITVENQKRFISSSLIAIEDEILGPREMLTGKLMFALLPAKTARTGRYQVRFMQRGRYRLGPTRITSRFPLGIVERGRQVEVYDELLVYPRIGHLAFWWLRQLTNGQQASRTAQGQTGAFQDEFHRIREYRPGDEIRSIHWKTSARKNELIVREYRQNRDRKLLLIVDLPEPSGELSAATKQARQQRTEHAVSLAATVGWNYLQECGAKQLDCLCFGQKQAEWLGSHHEFEPESFLDLMADAESGSNFKFADVEHELQQRLSVTTRCILITTRTEQQVKAAMTGGSQDRAQLGHGLMIIEADPEKTAEFFELKA